MSAINAILDIINSKTDRSGNRYWAFRYTRCSDGKQVVGKVTGGHSNIAAIPYELHNRNWEPRDTYVTTHEFSYREFKQLTKEWEYAGCTPETLAQYITEYLEH